MRLNFYLAAAILSTGLAAHADTQDLFSYTGVDALGVAQTVTFVLPASPTTINTYPGLRFYLDDVSVTIDGTTYNDVQLSFGSSVPTFGGVVGQSVSNPLDSFTLNTAALFSGTTATPAFVLDAYPVSSAEVDGDLLLSPTASPGTLTISSYTPSSVTPEPSSFALLGTGLLGVAGVVKRRLP